MILLPLLLILTLLMHKVGRLVAAKIIGLSSDGLRLGLHLVPTSLRVGFRLLSDVAQADGLWIVGCPLFHRGLRNRIAPLGRFHQLIIFTVMKYLYSAYVALVILLSATSICAQDTTLLNIQDKIYGAFLADINA